MYTPSTHPIASFARAVHTELDGLASVEPLYMPTTVKKTALVELERARERLAGLEMRIMATGLDVTDDGAYRSVADFLSNQARVDRAPLAALERLGRTLEGRWHLLATAVADGRVAVEKAAVIARALDSLLEDGHPSALLDQAEAHLVKEAPAFPATQVGLLARRVLDVVAPQIGEAEEAKRLEREERNAARRLFVNFHARAGGNDGVTEIRIRTSDAIAARLRTHLESLTAPRHLNTVGGAGGAMTLETRRPHTQRLGEAFNTLIETLDPGRLPIHGGTATTLMVTIALEDLKKDLAAASVTGSSEGEQRITAAEARRLACNAQIIPAVLNGKSEILDLGRAKRLFTPAQRKAMALRDKTCRADACTMPVNWCEAHHFEAPWSHGGQSNLKHSTCC